MNIIPDLNLNKHPKDIKNGTLVDAVNMMIDNDTLLLCNENSFKEINVKIVITDKDGNDKSKDTTLFQALYYLTNGNFKDYINEDNNVFFKLVGVIPCNTEIIFFCKGEVGDTISLIRYNETTNYCTKSCDIEDLNSGKNEYHFTGTFTYNLNHLIISFSLYNKENGELIPLRVIDLDDESRHNTSFHPICPEVYLPKVNTDYTDGYAYKGWYYIFIRYKIANNNYTQWYNTFQSVFVDRFEKTTIENYVTLGSELKNGSNGLKCVDANSTTNKHNNGITISKIETLLSDTKDICNLSFKTIVDELDHNYSNYQLGFIIIRKDSTKCFRTNDIETINKSEFIFNIKDVIEDSAINMVQSYTNYFNVNTIDNYKNSLYIGNYKELNIDEDLDLKQITVNISTDEDISTIDDTEKQDGLYGIYKNTEIKVNTDNGYIVLNPFLYFNGNKLLSLKTDQPTIKYTATITYNEVINPNFTKRSTIENIPLNNIKYDSFRKKYIITNKNGNTKEYDTKYYTRYYVPIGSMSPVAYQYCNFIKPKIKITATDLLDNKTVYKYDLKYDNITFKNYIAPVKVTESDIITILNSCNTDTGWYNLFIHFIDKYGNISRGHSLNEFTLNEKIKIGRNSNNDTLIYLFSNNNNNIELTIPIKYREDIVDYIVTYEKYENDIVYSGWVEMKLDEVKDANTDEIISYNIPNKMNFYTDRLDVDDIINFNFNNIYITFKDGIPFTELNITSKKILPCDTYENITNITNILLEFNNTTNILKCYTDLSNFRRDYNFSTNSDGLNSQNKDNIVDYSKNLNNITTYFFKATLLKDNVDENTKYLLSYNSKDKELIPCSIRERIIDNSNGDNNYNVIVHKINTKTKFDTTVHTLLFKGQTYKSVLFNDTFNAFVENVNFITEDNITNVKLKKDKPDIIINPFMFLKYDHSEDMPWESWCFNNAPAIKFFPISGLHTTNKSDKSFSSGCIVDVKNTIDLYKQPNFNYYEHYPKVLTNYKIDSPVTSDFNKTIRRSNSIQDESYSINWRFFEYNAYKNIIENKGNIVKLIGIGTIFIVHTEHSIFQFNADEGLRTISDGEVQLANTDIWDLNYKELITSSLGKCGITNINHSIVGEFGYIFYDSSTYKFYNFDNRSLTCISDNINKFLRDLQYPYATFVDDKLNNRLIIKLFSNINYNDTITLTYNYKYKTFVSRHTHKLDTGYSTKSKLYLYNAENINCICTDDINHYGNYIITDTNNTVLNKDYQGNTLDVNNVNKNSVSILINTEYDRMKILDYISYKINKYNYIENIDDELNTADTLYKYINQVMYYAGDKIKIQSAFCDTGELNITNNETNDLLNSVRDPYKPYWELGKWNFNTIRNNIKEYINGNLISDNCNRLYGNWFIITFTINPKDINKIEFEVVDPHFNKNIT